MENNNSSIDHLRQEWAAKVAILYDKTLDHSTKSQLMQEVIALQEQIEALEWQQMTPEQQARRKLAAKQMAEKFKESAAFVVIQTGG